MSENKQAIPLNMGLLKNRIDLVGRYNKTVGAPGPQVELVQREFIEERMRSDIVATFVEQYEIIIAARSTMQIETHVLASPPITE